MARTAEDIRRVFSANLNRQLEIHRKQPADLVNDLKFPASTVSAWTTGKKFPRIDKVQAIADYLGILKSDLTEDHEFNRTRLPPNAIPAADLFVQCPVYGNVRGGEGGIVTGEITGYTMVMKNLLVGDKSEYFCLDVVGHSMEPRICEGDTILVRSQSMVSNGEVAIVTVDGEEGVVKKVCYGDNWLELQSFNPYYPPRRFEREEMNRVFITGKVMRIIDREI